MKNSFGKYQVGLGLVLLLVVLGVAGMFTSAPSQDLSLAFCRPTAGHWFGCDPYGVPIANRILSGAWRSLRVATIVTALTMIIGLLFGTTSALAPRWLDRAMSQVLDWFLAFPGLLLAILVASIMPHSEVTIILALAATSWTGKARFVRAIVRKTAVLPHVEAAKASGATTLRIVLRHIWPGLLGQFAVQGSLSMGQVILAEASLSFLGLGGTIGNPSWGRLVAEGRDYLVEAPHVSIIPGIVFVISVLAFNLVAEGLRNRLDPMRNVRVY